jgi:plasmid stability protein
MSILDVDDVMEIIERIRAENKARSAENESRRIWYEKMATNLCGRRISVNFTTDIGSTYTGAEAIGSSDRSSIVILNDLSRVTERSVFCHEVAHAYLQHSSGSGDHTASQKEFMNALPETVREEVRAEIDGKEIDADKFGRKLFKAFWPDETYSER